MGLLSESGMKDGEVEAAPVYRVALYYTCRCCVPLALVLLAFSLTLLLFSLPLVGTPESDDELLRSPVLLSLRWKLDEQSPPPPSPPAF